MPLVETGNEPEYYVTDIARIEAAGDGDLRLFLASKRGGHLRIEYSAVMPRSALREMARMLVRCADQLDTDQKAGAH